MKYRYLLLLASFFVFSAERCPDKKDPVPQVKAEFTYEYLGEGKVKFANKSENATAFTWDFGDNRGVSTVPNPTYEYGQEGTFSVSLRAQGTAETAAKTAQVEVKEPLPGAAFSYELLPEGEVRFKNESAKFTTSSWAFDGQSTSAEANPTYKFSKNGKFRVALTVENKFRKTATFSDSVVVNNKTPKQVFIRQIAITGYAAQNSKD